MKSENADAFVAEYEKRKDAYAAFASAVKSILEILLKNDGFKYQITARGKLPESLRRKLAEGKLPQIKTVAEVQDLAACRVLFYIESDIERFARCLYSEFEVIRRDDRYSVDDYNAVDFVVKLKENRTALPEYAQFAGMICEIQLSTILYHAWSEVAHDIIYKPPHGLPEFDKPAYESLINKFKTVMEDDIKKASFALEFINRQFERIKQGKQVFDIDFLSNIGKSDSLNEIYENLKLLAEYVGEFGDKTPKELSVISIVKTVLNKSPKLQAEPVKTAIGELRGSTFADVLNVCLEILDTLRYWHPEETFDLVVALTKSDDFSVRQHALKVLERLAEYNLGALERVGYAFQSLVLSKVEQWSDAQLIDYMEVVLLIGEELLTPHFEGTSWQDEKTLALTSGVLGVNQELREIRRKTIDILRRSLGLFQEFHGRQRILQVLETALTPSFRGRTPEMDDLIAENASTIIHFYIQLASTPGTDGLILELIEQQLRWPRQIGAERLKNLATLEELLSSNEEYQVFRTLVGYDGRVAPDFDFEKERLERSKKVEEFAENISAETISIWRNRFLSILKNYDASDYGKYSYLRTLLTKFGQQNPDLALAFLREKEVELNPVLLDLVSGIWSSRKETAKELILGWVHEGKYLPECASIFTYVQEADQSLFDAIYEKAAQTNDCTALNNLVDSLARNYARFQNASEGLIRIIRELAKHKDTGWIHRVWFYKESPIAPLAEGDYDAILENLLWMPRIDYEADEILKPIADRFPLKVVGFFHDRIGIQLQAKKEEGPIRYDAIPFSLQRLREPLGKHEEIVIPAVLEWYGEGGSNDGWLYCWEASHFLNIIFPSFSPALERYVIGLIESGRIEAIDNVFYLLRSYKGEGFLWQICKAIIKRFESDENYLEIESDLFGFLSQTGTVTGEYGFVNAYERKREDIKSWQDDDAPKLKQFLKRYDTYLEKRVLFEKKRADEDIQLRKMRFEK